MRRNRKVLKFSFNLVITIIIINKDKSCLRRLLHLVQKRRKLLVYLRTANFTRYHTLLEELNLRPVQDSKYGYIKKE